MHIFTDMYDSSSPNHLLFTACRFQISDRDYYQIIMIKLVVLASVDTNLHQSGAFSEVNIDPELSCRGILGNR